MLCERKKHKIYDAEQQSDTLKNQIIPCENRTPTACRYRPYNAKKQQNTENNR